MMYRKVIHVESGRNIIERAWWCDRFASKLRGFTFRRQIPAGGGLVLVERNDSRLTTAIHMLFVFFDLGVIWVNSAGEIVDTALAKPWRPSYTPQAPAQYVIEGPPSILTMVKIGDHIQFKP